MKRVIVAAAAAVMVTAAAAGAAETVPVTETRELVRPGWQRVASIGLAGPTRTVTVQSQYPRKMVQKLENGPSRSECDGLRVLLAAEGATDAVFAWRDSSGAERSFSTVSGCPAPVMVRVEVEQQSVRPPWQRVASLGFAGPTRTERYSGELPETILAVIAANATALCDEMRAEQGKHSETRWTARWTDSAGVTRVLKSDAGKCVVTEPTSPSPTSTER